MAIFALSQESAPPPDLAGEFAALGIRTTRAELLVKRGP
jgi:hypothetical protein